MEQLVQDAIDKGLSEICFTDHVDYGIKEDWKDLSDTYHPEEKNGLPVMNVKYPAYHAEINRLRKKYTGTIITIGSNTHKPEHLAAHMKEVSEKLKQIGFTSFCTFQNMQPIFHQL